MNIILDKQLGFNLYRVSLLFRRELMRCLREYSMTPEQWQTLVTLWHKDYATQTDLSRITLQDAPSISRMLVRMEKNDLILRETDPEDKRQTRITLTNKGRQLKNKLPNKVLSHFENYMQKFPVEKRKELLVLLGELRIAVGD